MITSSWQNLVKFLHLKTIAESISCNVVYFFYSKSSQREIGHSKGTRALGEQKLRTLRGFQGRLKGTRSLEGRLGTRGTLFSRLISLCQVPPFVARSLAKEENGRPVRRIYGNRQKRLADLSIRSTEIL